MVPNKNTIVDLLNHLIKERRDISWKMGVGYHDGINISIYEILIFEIKNNRTISKIAFNGNSGKLLKIKVCGYRQKMADNIIDAILDINNFLRKGIYR
ncbi:hypothetical protein GCM10011506_34800 [Marivirga lumbricoides]|uniref:Uncharacterized protein n=1 Tax=Marivirga lumbricoides TaxID=1046115 RepID=A0A2T4DW10_9BACT|nr:hypothetical protein C9994_00810 [Marivirga lumbricoides]GGC46218.1 hypothetical protein GCM10011506_34800 [Marivirga lumbricoides]